MNQRIQSIREYGMPPSLARENNDLERQLPPSLLEEQLNNVPKKPDTGYSVRDKLPYRTG